MQRAFLFDAITIARETGFLSTQRRRLRHVLTIGQLPSWHMKHALLTFLIVALGAVAVSARTTDTITLRVGEQTIVRKTKLTIRFEEVIEDSRCPMNARCVWAGNAQVKISVANGKKAAKAFELNSTSKPQSVDYEGYRITYEHLTEKPTGAGVATAVRPSLRLSITKLKK